MKTSHKLAYGSQRCAILHRRLHIVRKRGGIDVLTPGAALLFGLVFDHHDTAAAAGQSPVDVPLAGSPLCAGPAGSADSTRLGRPAPHRAQAGAASCFLYVQAARQASSRESGANSWAADESGRGTAPHSGG